MKTFHNVGLVLRSATGDIDEFLRELHTGIDEAAVAAIVEAGKLSPAMASMTISVTTCSITFAGTPCILATVTTNGTYE